MAQEDKNILITPSKGIAGNSDILFRGAAANSNAFFIRVGDSTEELSFINNNEVLMNLTPTKTSISQITEANSIATGALTVAGGVGISKNLYVGGTIFGTLNAGSGINLGGSSMAVGIGGTYTTSSWVPGGYCGSGICSAYTIAANAPIDNGVYPIGSIAFVISVSIAQGNTMANAAGKYQNPSSYLQGALNAQSFWGCVGSTYINVISNLVGGSPASYGNGDARFTTGGGNTLGFSVIYQNVSGYAIYDQAFNTALSLPNSWTPFGTIVSGSSAGAATYKRYSNSVGTLSSPSVSSTGSSGSGGTTSGTTSSFYFFTYYNNFVGATNQYYTPALEVGKKYLMNNAQSGHTGSIYMMAIRSVPASTSVTNILQAANINVVEQTPGPYSWWKILTAGTGGPFQNICLAVRVAPP